uniref:flavin reductase (NADPH)-like n=1 Tax=Styela clava TaxID=7725 RepID=UPI00193985E6|nr:flavin reductase (NADPH)-like [Styela clava]
MAGVKRIIIFGATGQTGSRTLQRAINEGLQVSAYVRTPSKISEDVKKNLYKVIQGDVLDKSSVEKAIEGNDAVISALGATSPFAKTTVMSEGCSNIISGMKKHNVKKLIVVSGAIYLASEAGIFATLMKTLVKSTEDHVKQLSILENASSNIDWIAVMPPWIKDDKEVNPNYLYKKDYLPGVSQVTTAEIADFMIKTLMDDDKVESLKHSQIAISSKPKQPSNCPGTIGMALLVLAVGSAIYFKY